MMLIERIVLGELQTNCYILKAGGQAVIIDPGAEDERVLKPPEDCQVKYILNTHCHPDHIGGVRFLKQRYGAKLLFHKDEQAIFNRFNIGVEADRFLADGDLIEFGNDSLKVLHTPGHSPGSVTFFFGTNLFTGDLLFAGSIGRTDLPGGSYKAMARSLRRIVELEGDYTIYPGHGPVTTLDKERKSNPYLLELEGRNLWLPGRR